MWLRLGCTLVARYCRADATKPVADSPSAPAIALRTAIIIAIHFLIPLGSIFCELITLYVDDANIQLFLNMRNFLQQLLSFGGLLCGMFHVEYHRIGLTFGTFRPNTTAPATANVPKLPQQYFAGVKHPHHKPTGCWWLLAGIRTRPELGGARGDHPPARDQPASAHDR